MAHWAKPGVKCVLIDASPGRFGSANITKVGDVCEVLDVDEFGGVVAIQVREVNGRWVVDGDDYSRASRFRPLVTRTQEQDLQHFVPLLVNITSDEDA